MSSRNLKIAVEGCGHGSLNLIYSTIEKQCASRGWTIYDLDFLIICGDFQAMRNERDLNCMSVPKRFRSMENFHEYYSGEKKAPVLTLVIGGNHEASNYLSELYYGGWLAPNIYYLGDVGVVRYGPYRIAGMSGIYYRPDYGKSHYEQLPYDRNEMRTIYHVRECDVSKLLQIRSPIDIAISHDWPRRVEWFGDYKKLFVDRPTFFDSAKIDNLGSAPAEQVLTTLKPRHWFSGHMHVKFSAVVEHTENTADDIFKDLTISDEYRAQLPKSMFKAAFPKNKSTAKSLSSNITNTVTQFLALDKPGPGREFLELVEIEPPHDTGDIGTGPYMEKTSDDKYVLYYDEEWLAVLRSSGNSNSIDAAQPDSGLDWIQENITSKGLLKIPENFEKHGPTYDPSDKDKASEQPEAYPNSQTEAFCKTLQITNKFSVGEKETVEGDFIVFE